jgi:hypothetical protein
VRDRLGSAAVLEKQADKDPGVAHRHIGSIAHFAIGDEYFA